MGDICFDNLALNQIIHIYGNSLWLHKDSGQVKGACICMAVGEQVFLMVWVKLKFMGSILRISWISEKLQ